MNKIYKTVWNAVRQQFVVADEKMISHAARGGARLAVAGAVAAFVAGAASAAYIPSYMTGSLSLHLTQTLPTFETAEYKADWGLSAMHASTAYALGFTGKGVAVGMMDSGALLQKHPDLSGDRWHAVHAQGQYSGTGNRYPQGALPQFDGTYEAGESFDITGDWKLNVNDSHGTHVVGTIGGNRDGNEFHGVAWESNVYVGNTGGTDDSNYGPFLDYGFFKTSWSALATAVSEANNGRGGFINNSFGTNTRVKANGSKGADGGNTSVHLPVNTPAESEYEFFLFNKVYGQDKSFVDAAYEAVKDNGVVQVMTTGNRDMKNPYYRALYPYFNPDAETHWVAVAGLQKAGTDANGNTKYGLIKTFNEAGIGKWWTVVAPGSGIYSSAVVEGSYVEPGVGEGAGKELGDYTYASWSGTSMAAPHVTGALGVLMSRYMDMDAFQVREVMFTTANHKNADGSNFDGWTAKDGEVDERMGWGAPDLSKGMFGPGQFLGDFKYNMATTTLDVWSNEISNIALTQRQKEDAAWKAAAEKWIAGTALTAEENALIGDLILDTEDDIVGLEDAQEKVSEADAKAWREAYFEKRINAIKNRVYKGSLEKLGAGTLVMTGNNTYEGTTKVTGGTLLAFTESIGTDNKVTIGKDGTFGVLSNYNDTFTKKGYLTSQATAEDQLTLDFAEGGTLYIDAGSDVTVKSVTGTGIKLKVGIASLNEDKRIALYHAGKAKAAEGTVSGTFTVTGESSLKGLKIEGSDSSESVFFTVTGNGGTVSDDGKSISVALSSEKAASFTDFATNANTRSIARALETSTAGFAGTVLGMGSKEEVQKAYQDLDDDFYASARNGLVMNSLAVSRTVIDQARGMGEGRAVEMENGMGRIWATGIGHWGTSDGNKFDTDVDFRAGFIGGEFVAHETTKVGAYFGYGSSDYKANANKIDADNVHFGVYGMSDVGPASITYGFGYTSEDRDTVRSLGGQMSAHSEDASVMQLFAEAAYTGFDLGENKIQPYFGVSWAKVKTDSAADQYGAHTMTTDEIDDNIGIASVGVRAALPFTMGTMPVAVKADAGYSHFFGDTEGVTRLQLGKNGGWAEIEGSELKGLFNVGLGVTAQVAKSATVGINYGASLGSDQKTHGINATLRIAF